MLQCFFECIAHGVGSLRRDQLYDSWDFPSNVFRKSLSDGITGVATLEGWEHKDSGRSFGPSVAIFLFKNSRGITDEIIVV